MNKDQSSSLPDHITIMYGGISGEREVSLVSGRAVHDGLKEVGIQTQLLDIQSTDWRLDDSTEFVFLALHGSYGEDGQVQQKLESLDIPFSGSDSASSKLAFNKFLSKEKFRKVGVPTPKAMVLETSVAFDQLSIELPLVIKPVQDGSSLGLEFVHSENEFLPALTRCLQVSNQVLVEEFVNGRELTVGILNGQSLPVIEIIPSDGGYNYKNKYTQGGARHICPATLDDATQSFISETALKAFTCLGCTHYGRVDIMLTQDQLPQVLEVNTLPGLTELSLFPEAAEVAGYSFPQLCKEMIRLSWDSHLSKNNVHLQQHG